MNSAVLFIEGSSSNHSSECIKITNPRILEFYSANPDLNFEKINLWILEILQHRAGVVDERAIFSLKPEEKHKTDELLSFSKKMREAIHAQIQHVLSESVAIKTTYIYEFRAIYSSGSDAAQMKESNNAFTESMRVALSSLLNCRNGGMAERINAMLRQFHKILNANVDAFLSTKSSVEAEQTVMEYITNFDSNTTHMVNAISQLLSDYATTKEKQIQMAADLLRTREDASSGAYYKLIYELNDFLQQIEEDVEHNKPLDIILAKTFPTASIHSETNSHTIVREGKHAILLEMHENKDRNIGPAEVKSFLKTAVDKNMASILISLHTGISSKSDYQIEIQNNRVVLYLHRLDANPDKLQIAVDMIDSLSSKLDEFCVNTEHKYSIPKDVLDDVNREYQQFIIQKESIVNLLKDQHKRVLSQMEEIRFASLDKYLSTRYSSCKKQGFVCDLCHVFNVPTLKGLAAHKRGCARKLAVGVSPSSDDLILLKLKKQ